ncbi:50S ribosomal protein L11 methyltransferase [Solwaraspora sp. WMMB335]|uniref:50S ribosomal protein L11 methyltransferase n=1 Tax=Solwaraspora sp. WMMB335 TaxID=3404118 RepID=UPI003B9454E2
MSRLVDVPFTTDLHLRLLLSVDRGHNVQRAVRAATRTGDRVLDAGTGSGLLSFVALRAGAVSAVGVDRQHLELAQAVAEKNGLADRMTFLQADLMDLDLPPAVLDARFDLLLAFIYTNHPLIDEARSRMVFELRDRFCVPDARIVPGAVRYSVAACERLDWDLFTERADLDASADVLRSVYGLDFQPLIDSTKQELPIKRSRPTDPAATAWRPPTSMASVRFDRRHVRLLSDTDTFHMIDYAAPSFTGFPGEARLRAAVPGRVTGLLWTQELLYDGQPVWTTETYSPLAAPLAVSTGDTIVARTGEQWRATNTVPAQVERG